MKIIFLGTPEIGVPVLKKVASQHDVVAVITQPDKPAGRSKKRIPSPIAVTAKELQIPVFKPLKIDPAVLDELTAYQADIFLTFAFGMILRKDFFAVTKQGGMNIHPSLLPLYRGPSPLQTALFNGEKKSGITIQQVALKVDSGDILWQEAFDISDNINVVELKQQVSQRSAEIILPFLADWEAGKITPQPQLQEQATYCHMISKDQGLIDWNQSAVQIHNQVRAFMHWPIAHTFLDGIKLNIYQSHLVDPEDYEWNQDVENGTIVNACHKKGVIIKTGAGFIAIISLQLAGKKVLKCNDFLNGCKDLNLKKLGME
ncbi:MAG: methionyl-tRNA formyltransferase [Spirochaetes bacterium]|nr:methionyl-tRNA formyltransferase [Spirochaetota bacterium]